MHAATKGIINVFTPVISQRDDTQESHHQDEVKFLVYKSHLLSLFMACRSRHQYCDAEFTQQMGIFIRIKQHCRHCGHEWTWNNQPFIKNTPVGNILLSAAILFRQCTAGKALRFLQCLKVVCITDRTFYLHQTWYTLSQLFYLYGKTTKVNCCQQS